MKITVSQLKQLIKEAIEDTISMGKVGKSYPGVKGTARGTVHLEPEVQELETKILSLLRSYDKYEIPHTHTPRHGDSGVRYTIFRFLNGPFSKLASSSLGDSIRDKEEVLKNILISVAKEFIKISEGEMDYEQAVKSIKSKMKILNDYLVANY